jgi:uncharacterized protein
LAEKAACLHRVLGEYGRVGIAFSGGVDSSFLLKTALDVLGRDNVVILHSRSCLQTKEEQEQADSWLQRHGYGGKEAAGIQKNITLHPLQWSAFTANPENRCYLCKQRLYSCFLEELKGRGIALLLDGTNLDDLEQGEGRPGLRAIAELGVQTPLADCELRKNEIRQLSRVLGLDTSDQPPASCLATRIPMGLDITEERLARIAAWEQTLVELGVTGCRARLDRESARTVYLQLPEADLGKLLEFATRESVINQLKKKGADKVYLDLQGR